MARYIQINATADGDNTVVAAPAAGFKILVLGFLFTLTAAGAALWRSGAAGTTHARFSQATGPNVSALPARGMTLFECDPAQALVFNTAAGQDALGFLVYEIVPA